MNEFKPIAWETLDQSEWAAKVEDALQGLIEINAALEKRVSALEISPRCTLEGDDNAKE